MTDNRIWVAGLSLAVVAILGGGWFIGVSPQLAEADLARADRQDVEMQNAAESTRLVTLRDQFAGLDALTAELADLQREIPTSADIETFIDEITMIAAESGVTITSIAATEATTFGGTVVDAAAVVPTSEDGSVAELESGIFTVGISIDVAGAPEQVLAFTSGIQKGKRFFLANSVSFTPSEESATGTITGYLFVARGANVSAAPADSLDDPAGSTVAAG